MRFQKRIEGGRAKLYSGVLPQIERKIEQLAAQHDCSKSFVTNTILAEALNILVEEHYYDNSRIARKAKKAS